MKTVENCERMRCCELRRESAIDCEDCIIKDTCETRKITKRTTRTSRTKEKQMANNNETVASVADCIRHLADTLPNGVILNIAQCNFTADRIEAVLREERLSHLHRVYAYDTRYEALESASDSPTLAAEDEANYKS